MSEEWRPVVGYEGVYEVSSHGRVRRILFCNRSITKPCSKLMAINTSNRYGRVFLAKNNEASKGFLVHVLVLLAFHGPKEPGQVCRHLDGKPLNNHRDNLKWGTPAENEKDKKLHGTALIGEKNPKAKLTANDVRQIRAMFGTTTVSKISKKFGIAASAIYAIRNREKWKHI